MSVFIPFSLVSCVDPVSNIGESVVDCLPTFTACGVEVFVVFCVCLRGTRVPCLWSGIVPLRVVDELRPVVQFPPMTDGSVGVVVFP